MIENALEYARKGWAIFPVIPGDKKPLVKDWQSVATTDEETIRAWWEKTPDANIGFPCGKANGIAVIDVDVSEKGNGYRELEALDIEEWETYYQQTPRGGRHFFFHIADKCVKNAVGYFGQGSCVDVRGEGGYVLLAPSVTSAGEYSVEEMDFDEFPDVFIRNDESVGPKVDISHLNVPDVALQYDKRIDEAKQYIKNCHPAIQGDGGHVALLITARELVWGYMLKAEEAINLLWSEYNPRCVPPWDSSNPVQVKDFERKVYEAFNFPPLTIAGYRLSVVKKELDALALALIQGKTVKDIIGDPEPVKNYEIKEKLFTPDEDVEVETVKHDRRYDPVATMWNDYENGYTKSQLSKAPGIVGDLAKHIWESAGKPQPFLALGASLTAHAAVMGRQYRDEDDTRTNMFCIGIANSSSGKDHPTKTIDNLLMHAGANDMIGGSDVTADTALVKALQDMQYKTGYIMIWDECGHVLSGMKNNANGKSSSTVITLLMKLYSNPRNYYRHKLMSREGSEAIVIPYPHVCMWGVTTHNALFDNLTMSSMQDGFMGRIMPFLSNLNPVYLDNRSKPIPDHILEHFSVMYQQACTAKTLDAMPEMHTIKETSGAKLIRHDFARKCEKLMFALSNDKTFLWGKAHENCRKIALTIAGGMPEKLITAEVMDYAVNLTRLLLVEYQNEVDKRMFEGMYDKEIKCIYQKLERKFKNKWFRQGDLTRVVQHYPKKQREEYKQDFLDPENGYVTYEYEKEDPTQITGRMKLNKIGDYSVASKTTKKGKS